MRCARHSRVASLLRSSCLRTKTLPPQALCLPPIPSLFYSWKKSRHKFIVSRTPPSGALTPQPSLTLPPLQGILFLRSEPAGHSKKCFPVTSWSDVFERKRGRMGTCTERGAASNRNLAQRDSKRWSAWFALKSRQRPATTSPETVEEVESYQDKKRCRKETTFTQ